MKFNEVKLFYEQQNCILLSKESDYKNNQSKLKFMCKCGVETIKNYKLFKLTKQCIDCGNKQRVKSNRTDFNEVESVFKENGCTLLSKESDYKNKDSLLRYICDCGEENKIRYNNFRNGQRCSECYRERSRRKKYIQIKFLFEVYRCEFLNEYNKSWSAKDKQKYKCICGEESTISAEQLKRQTKSIFYSFDIGFCYACQQKRRSKRSSNVWGNYRDRILNGINNINQQEKMSKLKKTNMEKYGFEYVLQNEETRKKGKQTILDRYGVEHPNQNEEIREKIKQTNLVRYGVESPMQNEEIREKLKQTNLERYGVESVFQNEETREKIKQTFLERYGVENPNQNEEIKEKVKQTNLERYGVSAPMQNEDIKEKVKQTNLERYGVSAPMQNEEVKEKAKQTNLERYGVESPMQNEEVKEKTKQTNLERYGGESPMQNIDVFVKSRQYKKKEYIFPSGRIEYVEGYENMALDMLLLKYKEDDIIVADELLPKIWYKVNDKNKRYYGDIYIKSENKIIEVKSEYIYKFTKNATEYKKQAVIDNGYKFELIIL